MLTAPLLLASLLLAPAPQEPNDVARSQLAALCPATATVDSKTLLKQEQVLVDSMILDRTTERWAQIGCLRTRLALAGVAAPEKRAALAMPRNSSWFDGATDAFVRVASDDRTVEPLTRMVLAATLALDESPRPRWVVIDRAAALLFAQIRRGDVLTATLREGCPRLLLAVSDTASARNCLHLIGQDPTVLPRLTPLTAPITLLTHYYRLWYPQEGTPMGLATFWYNYDGDEKSNLFVAPSAFRTEAEILAPTCAPPEGRTAGNSPFLEACRVEADIDLPAQQNLDVSIWNSSTRVWQVDRRAEPLYAGARRIKSFSVGWEGFVRFRASTQASAWSIAVRLDKAGVGGRASADNLPPLSQEKLFLSDVVLGSATSTLRAAVGPDSLRITPDNRMSRGAPVHLYVQVGSDVAMPNAVMTLVVLRAGAKEITDGNGVKFESRTPVAVGITPVKKQLGIAALKPGDYEIAIELRDPASGRIARQRSPITILK